VLRVAVHALDGDVLRVTSERLVTLAAEAPPAPPAPRSVGRPLAWFAAVAALSLVALLSAWFLGMRRWR
jgi:hypothetical protein